MKPLKDLIVIKLSKTEEVEKGGILFSVPKWAKPESLGTVLEVGPDVKNVKKGKQYLIYPYGVIDTEDKQIKIVREKDVLCQVL